MTQYRKKPVVIDAIRFPGINLGSLDEMMAFEEWLEKRGHAAKVRYQGSKLLIGTLEGDHEARPGDMIIEGVKGEIYPCKPDIFAATYEAVEG